MLDHFDPDGSHIPVVMSLFAEFQKPKSTPGEGELSYNDSSRDVSFAWTAQYSGQRIGDGVLDHWWALLVGILTRWMGRSEPHGIDSCDPSGA